ncbi:ribose 5-phosphate isomerase B [Aequitasia blattaphilus]|uniref:Ribose 5-phosphate isomerase B n=1 Tax=Aequitasia blattaphilus TaxID=2949332 RepID=A0ABT1EA01_9FIRM|nr:ribose 5-phosphate isomerase B [Aequitasia blattaphilus]MCP1102661.1 ribose 5-phosphate isomerase B [Aequitasia blattaphilus]MCR8615301.1 ribose 5-phosphate isomerase B [Aequitasia blattaphilus]
MKLGIASDHAGYELKCEIINYLSQKGLDILDYGTDNVESVSYVNYGKVLGEAVAKGEVEKGIAICGTGVGISIAANKVKGVRAAVCSEPTTARLVKQHNNANVIAFGARIVGTEVAKFIVDEWLDAEFQGGRHAERISEIHSIED